MIKIKTRKKEEGKTRSEKKKFLLRSEKNRLEIYSTQHFLFCKRLYGKSTKDHFMEFKVF